MGSARIRAPEHFIKINGVRSRMRRRGAASPNQWDAIALTFAEPVADPRFRPQAGVSEGGVDVRVRGAAGIPPCAVSSGVHFK
jgi:hypothetical protein